MGFQTPQLPLGDLLDDVRQGKVQLPDFQREYKWDDERIRSLLATLTLGHPMGAIMLLDTGGEDVRFKPRPIAGVSLDGGRREPEHLLLDGQQRITSLFGALGSGKPVDTTVSRERKKRIRRWYYLDIAKALSDPAGRDEAIVSVPEDRVERKDFGRQVIRDLSAVELEQAAELFPLRLAYDMGEAMAWLFGYAGGDQGRQQVVQRFNAQILTPMHGYKIPAIQLPNETTKEAVCTVFEKVNTGGLALDVFELLTAMFAGNKTYYDQYGEDFRLNEHWAGIRTRLAGKPALTGLESSDFLQGVTLLATMQRANTATSARRADILKLTLNEYLTWSERLEQGFMWAAQFLAGEHIFDNANLPYRTQLVPLAVMRVLMGADIDTHGPAARLRQWYWCGVLGEQYGGSVETRFARDVEQAPAWATGASGVVPETVSSAGFRETRLLTLKTRNSSAYKGIHALVIRKGAKDWARNVDIGLANFHDLKLDIHHVFPYAWCEKNGVDSHRRDCVVNKTPLSAETNRSIGGRAPSVYLSTLESKTGLTSDGVDEMVAGHHIRTTTLRNDNFDDFFDDRMARLVGLIEAAMGRSVVRDVSQPEIADDVVEDDRPEHYEPEADDTEDSMLLESGVSA